MFGLRRPGRSAPPPRPAAGRPGSISIQQHFLSSTLLISKSHSALSCLWGFILLCFSFHLFCVTVCVFISLFFNESSASFLFFFFHHKLIRPIRFPFYFLFFYCHLFCWWGSMGTLWRSLITWMEKYWSIQNQMWSCHRRIATNGPVPNIITVMSVWSHTQEIK